MRIPALALFLCLTAALPALAEAPPMPASPKLTERDKTDIARIEKYLNDLKSVEANFTQVNDAGEFRHGKIAIQRPGKMRVTYAPPENDFIVADGTFVHIWDDGMKQQTNVPVGSSIAEFILRDPIKLSGDVKITGLTRFPAKLEVSLVSVEDPGEGELTLIFEDKPLQLRQWRVVDAQGRMTGVNLESPREGVTFSGNTFDFVPPKNLGQHTRGNK